MKRFLTIAGACALVACGETPTAPPSGPDPTDPVEPVVASVTLSSPIGGIVAVGASTRLEAAAADASGAPVSASFAWSSSDGSIATVSSTGDLTGIGPGTATITAAADAVAGTLEVTVANADLASLRTLLDDPLADGLLTRITGDAGTALRATWSRCDTALTEGNLEALQSCATEGRQALSDNTDPSTGPLRSLLGLFLDWVDRFLNLT